MSNKLLDQIFNLKFTSKQLSKQAKKCEKDVKAEQNKAKKAMEKGNMDGAKIYAQNAIRKKTEGLNYLKLASRLDAVVSRLDTQAKMQMINKNMAGIVKNMEKALNSNNLEKVTETMDAFEKVFENMDVQSETVEQAMSNQANLSTPEGEVNGMLQQIADENGLEVSLGLPSAQDLPQAQATPAAAEDPLAQRFAMLQKR